MPNVAEKKVVPKKSITWIARFVPREKIPRFQTPFTPEIEGIDPLKKLTPPKFNLYHEKSDPMSHISHFKQMMALWNHLDAPMCKVFPSSLGDLGFKWFDKLIVGSIRSFYQLTESFMA